MSAFSFLVVEVYGSILRRWSVRTRVLLITAIGAGDESEGPELEIGAGLATALVFVDGIAVGEGSLVSKGAHVIFS